MQLSRSNLAATQSLPTLIKPNEEIFDLPERVLQFGTGVLLRALPDYFIDKANRSGKFNGRVVVVKSTDQGDIVEYEIQDNLYTTCIRGMDANGETEEFIINSSISRVLSAKDNWQSILNCAHNKEIDIIISNTTEVGISLVLENIFSSPPASYPGKLLAFLYERFRAFHGSNDSGMIIIPTELIVANGARLRDILLELAAFNNLPKKLINWISNQNHFCNSLVDRIVPGKLPAAENLAMEHLLGYSDKLMVMAEPYRLWAIETLTSDVRDKLSFLTVDKGVILADDIERFRELKLRLLNGTHTFCCGLAVLADFGTVKEAMTDKQMSAFIQNLSLNEIAIAVSGEKITFEEACQFAEQVLQRFRNPFLEHHWLSITLQYTAKMKMRNVPILLAHYRKAKNAPVRMAFGFAAYLLFMRCRKNEIGDYIGHINEKDYKVRDEKAGYFARIWEMPESSTMVHAVLANQDLWGTDLSVLPAFCAEVTNALQILLQGNILNGIGSISGNE